jgi:hypothetical protein
MGRKQSIVEQSGMERHKQRRKEVSCWMNECPRHVRRTLEMDPRFALGESALCPLNDDGGLDAEDLSLV